MDSQSQQYQTKEEKVQASYNHVIELLKQLHSREFILTELEKEWDKGNANLILEEAIKDISRANKVKAIWEIIWGIILLGIVSGVVLGLYFGTNSTRILFFWGIGVLGLYYIGRGIYRLFTNPTTL